MFPCCLRLRALSLLAACAPDRRNVAERAPSPPPLPRRQPPNGAAPAARTVTDMTGREITLVEPAKPSCAQRADCEVLYAVAR
jgi:ABC-type Fe3+-hydroxamate transport system substrate-binding protein